MPKRQLKASSESIEGLLGQLKKHGFKNHAKLIQEVLRDDFAAARRTLQELNLENINKIN